MRPTYIRICCVIGRVCANEEEACGLESWLVRISLVQRVRARDKDLDRKRNQKEKKELERQKEKRTEERDSQGAFKKQTYREIQIKTKREKDSCLTYLYLTKC